MSKPASATTGKATRTMKKSENGSKQEKAAGSPSRLIDARIKELGDWRGETLARIRMLIRSEENHEEERERFEARESSRLSLPADRCENQGVGRLAGRDAGADPDAHQKGGPRSGRGVEVERGSGVVAWRNHLHRRDVQECREDDLR